MAATCGVGGNRSGIERHSPHPFLLGPNSLQGAQGPVSAPGSAGHRGEGLWLLCTCSGPYGVAQGWRGVSQTGGRPRDLAEPSMDGTLWESLWVSPHLHLQITAKPLAILLSPLCWGLCHPCSLTPLCLGHSGLPRSLPPSQCPMLTEQDTRVPLFHPTTVPALAAPPAVASCGPHRYTSARMLSMVATSGWQWPELLSRSSKAWRHSGTATS